MSVLACKLGIKLIAGGGDIKVQAQDGHIEITSSKKIKLIASEEIELHSPAIKLVAHGTQIDCGSGRITQQSSGAHSIKSSKFEHTSGGSGTPEKLKLPSTEVEHDQQVLITDLQTDEPVRNRRYRISVEDGQVLEGSTDNEGLTKRFQTKTSFARYEIELLD
jgi:type VI secretion system secreted protein VgrG